MQHGGEEAVIDGEQCACVVGDVGECGDVAQVGEGVGGGFGK